MPLSGHLQIGQTYTLTEDCTLSDRLFIDGHDTGADIEVTVNGGENTIKWSDSSTNPVFEVGRGVSNSAATLNLNNLTVDLEGNQTASAMQVNASGTLNLSNVTLTGLEGFIGNGSGVYIVATGTSTDRTSVSLSNVLAADNSSAGFGSAAEGGFLRLKAYADATLNNVVIRNNYGNSAAISVHSTATMTASGCLTFSGLIPRNVEGTWTDNSTGACSGEIGNKGNATLAAPKTLPCGFPTTTTFDQNANYSLRGNCVIAGNYNLNQGVTVRINGNGHRFTSDSATPATFYVAYEATLILDNFHSENVAYINFGTLQGTKLHAKDLSRTSVVLNMGQAAFSQSIFSDNVGSYSGAAINNLHHYDNGAVTITDSIFRNNTSTSANTMRGAIRHTGNSASITLNGCITFENNSPADTVGTITDNRTGACADTDAIGPGPPTFPPSPGGPSGGSSDALPTEPPTESARLNCPIRLGAIGLICRGKDGGEPILEVWEISPAGVGAFALGIRQKQVEGAGEGITFCSANERARIQVGPLPSPESLEIWRWDPRYSAEIQVPRTYVTVSMGPNFEGKIHHAILDHTVEGRVLSTVDTYSRLEDCIANLTAPAKNRMLSDCMVTTKYILNFRAGPAGEIMGILPYNVSLAALQRTDGWFEVDYHGKQGWISADFVNPAGSCG